MTALDAQLHALAASLAPPPAETAGRDDTLDRVRRVLLDRWPNGRVSVFGSVATGLALAASNDLDVTLELDGVDDPASKAAAVTLAAESLTDGGMEDVLPLPEARVPVVKCVDPRSGTKVDVTINNRLALANTRLLATYAACEPRFAVLVTAVKHWAKRRAVNDPYRGTLSSYCYVLMCVHLLQTRSPPALPCLQADSAAPHDIDTIINGVCVRYASDAPRFAATCTRNTESVAELLVAFFDYWAWRHDYATAVVSVRVGGWVTKAAKDWTRRVGSERHLVGIEDPFEVAHDLGRTVDRSTAGVLQKEFERAAVVLRDEVAPLAALFEPYRSGNTKNGV